MKKKIISVFLCIVLCLTMMPTIVYADYSDGVNCEYCGSWRYDDWLCDGGDHCAAGYGCGDEHHCPNCGACEENVTMCPICNNFCSECDEWCEYHDMCTDCAVEQGGIHCIICGACGDEIDLCEYCGYCDDCAQDEGLHCKAGCGACIEDGVEMCDNCGLCYDCGGECSEGTDHLCLACHFEVVSNGACSDCGKCFIDNMYERCMSCFRCFDCGGKCESDCDDTCLECHIDNDVACPDCGKCFMNDDSQKCLLCGRCFDCGGQCASNCEDACLECHVDSGNACPDCGKCFMDDDSQKCLLCGRCFNCGGKCESDCDDICLECHLDNDIACPGCGKCFVDDDSAKCDICGYCNECEEWCDNCMMHVNCAIDEGKHCPECTECGSKVTICSECGNVCSSCADWCDNCNMCVECAINKGLHCQNCEECWEDVIICENCGEYCNSCADFCDSCEMCMVCAITVGLHCPNCEACTDDVTICQECKDVCSDCADDWCDTCNMCVECAVKNELHCEECGNCFSDAEKCPICGLCEECCNVNTTPARIMNVSVNDIGNRAVVYAYDYDSFTIAYDWNNNYDYQGKTPVVGDVDCDWSFYILGEDGYPVDPGKNDLLITDKLTITSDDISSLNKNARYLVWVNVSNSIVVHGSEKFAISFTQFYIDTLEHFFTIVKSAQADATCTTDGKTAVMQCEDCGRLTGGEIIPATGHNYKSNVTTPASCTSEGVRTFTCERCKDIYTEVIKKEAHTLQNVSAIPPMCTAKGKTEGQICSVCKIVISGCEDVEPLGHRYTVEKSAQINPTCTTDGKTAVMQCEGCGKLTGGETIPATGHNYKSNVTTPANCTSEGVRTFTCEGCKDIYTEVVKKEAHTPQNVSAISPMCTEKGKTEGQICSVCKIVISGCKDVEPLGHNYTVEKSAHINPTCTTDGKTAVMQCEVCGKLAGGETIPATGHTSDEGVVTKEATSSTTGEKIFSCVTCGTVLFVEELPVTEVPPTEDEPTKSPLISTDKAQEVEDAFVYTYTGVTVAEIASAVEGTIITTTDGITVEGDIPAATGMIAVKPDGTKVGIVVFGDVDGDGKISAADARLSLRRAVNIETYESDSKEFFACDVDFNNNVTSADARLILRASVGLEDPTAWYRW